MGKRHLQRPTKLLDGLRVIDKETPSRGEPVWQDETWFMWDGDVMVGELQREVAPRVVTPETWDKPDGIVYSGQFYVYQPDSFEPRALQRYQQIAEAEDGEIAPLGEEQIYFYQNDPNGMPIRLQDGEGEVVWEAQFTPFGQLSVTGTSQLRQPLRMQGQYYDTESGLHYNRYRYYDPACGVFISQDPIGLKGGLNPYQFAVNTLGWVDPLGLAKKTNEAGAYSEVGGHHVHAQAGFKNEPNYDKGTAFAIGQDYMKEKGLDHQSMTNSQRQGFKELNESGRPNTLAEHDKIAKDALIAGGATEEEANDLVKKSKDNLKCQNVSKPSNIPWYS
ncbi:RHS repeat-associated core domain protein [Yersinia pseudotuberculosis]|nr:RHS repeat-associated core domain protein [Yersinia pseudotuberculosis]